MRNLAQALSAHLPKLAADPWLFYRQGWDWRWLSFAEVAARVRAAAAALDGLDAGCRVGFADHTSTETFFLDLAVQAVGHLAVPVDDSLEGNGWQAALESRRVTAWVQLEGEEERQLPQGVVRVVVPWPEGGRWSAVGEDLPEPAAAGGGALVVGPDGPEELSAEELVTAAERLEEQLGSRPRREITVLAQPLERPLARLVASWATLTGAAVLLEPDQASLAATACWARATVLAGDAADLARLGRQLEPSGRGLFRRRRSVPCGRLHTLIHAAADPLAAADEAFWSARDVRLVPTELFSSAAVRR